VIPGVFLYDTAESKFWMIDTNKTYRRDIASYFNSSLYEYSGFTSVVSLDAIVEAFDNYELYIGVQEDDIWHLSLWGKLNIEPH
jgi:hypothetical protein